jgi:excisionase family DNA binding protein
MTGESDVLNAQQAAAFLGAHVETIRRLARRGGLPSFKVGKDWRFRREALVRWLEDQASSGGQPCVLVVDDDEGVRNTLARLLGRLGCRTRQATDGAAGLQEIAREAPDLVLLDLLMPAMTGPEFLRALRVTHPILPVVIVTGYPDSELMHEAARHGPLLLLAKPVDPDLLERTIRMVLGIRATAGLSPRRTP